MRNTALEKLGSAGIGVLCVVLVHESIIHCLFLGFAADRRYGFN